MSAEQHPFAPEEVMAFLDGEISGERTLAIAEHLEGCPECSSLAGDFSSLARQLEAWRVESSPVAEPSLTQAAISGVENAETSVVEAASTGTGSKKSRFSRLLNLKGPVVQRRWVWALGGAFGGVVLASSFVVMLRPPSAGPRETAPEIGPAAASGLNLSERKSANSNDVKVDGADAVGSSVNGMRSESTQRHIDNLPLNGRDFTDFTLKNSQTSRDKASNIGAAPRPGVSDTGPMIAKTVSLSSTVKDIDGARALLEQVAKEHHGYFAELSTELQSEGGHSLTASLRVPASELDAALTALRKLGRVLEEKQGGEEISQQYVDLKARLDNAKHTEKRLTDLLTNRTGKLQDVLDVERELASTREEIERMQAQERGLANRVSYSSIQVNLREEYKPALNLTPLGTGARLRNALVDGYRTATEGALNLLLFLLRDGPSLLLWALILFFPARWSWRKLRAANTSAQSVAGVI